MTVKPDDILLRAGGTALARYGTMRRRTAPWEEIPEAVTRNYQGLQYDRNGVLRGAAVNKARLNWRDLDGDGVRETPVVPLERGGTQFCEFNLPGKCKTAFGVSAPTVVNITDDFYLEVEQAGDEAGIDAPTAWNENEWLFAMWLRADFEYDDGVKHVAFEAYLNSSNYVRIYKDTDNLLKLSISGSGSAGTVSRTETFSARDEIFIGARHDAGGWQIETGVKGVDNLDWSGSSPGKTFASGSWAFHVGTDKDGANPWIGGLNIAILNETYHGASGQAYIDRFGGGDGEASETWLDTYNDDLVLYLSAASGVPMGGGTSPPVVRNDTGTYWDVDGVIQAIAANLLRNKHYMKANDSSTYRTTLLEKSFENVNTENDLTQWFRSGTPQVTGGQPDPAGGNNAYTVEDDSAGGTEYIEEAYVFTGSDTPRGVFFIVKENTHPGAYRQNLTILATSGTPGFRLKMEITSWSSGEPQINENIGTLLGKWELYGGYWILLCQTVQLTISETHSCRLYPASSGTGKIDVFLCGAFDELYFLPLSVLSASEVTTKDILTDSYTEDPQESNWFTSFIYTGYHSSQEMVIWQIGANASEYLRLHIDQTPVVSIMHHNGSDEVGAGKNLTSAGVEYGDLIEVRVHVADDGDVRLELSINGVSKGTTAYSTGDHGLASSFTDQNIYYAADSAGGDNSFALPLIEVKGHAGTEMTMAQLRALTGPDLHHYYAGIEDSLILEWDILVRAPSRPSLAGKGMPWGVATAEVVSADSEGLDEVFDAGLSGYGDGVIKLLTGQAGTYTRRYVFGFPGLLNSLIPGDPYSQIVGVYIDAAADITPANVKLNAYDDVTGATAGEAMTALGEWQWLTVQMTVNGGAAEAYFYLTFEDGENFGTANDVLYMALPTIVNGLIQPMPQINDDEDTVAYGSEILTLEHPSPPQLCTILLKFVERGSMNVLAARLLQIADAAGTAPRLFINAQSDQTYKAWLDSTAAADRSSKMAAGPALGNRVSLVLQVPVDAAILLFQSLNGATTTTGDQAGSDTFPDAWSDELVTVGGEGDNTDVGAMELMDLIIARGSHTLAEMEAVI